MQTDHGAHFASDVFRNTCKLLIIKKFIYGFSPGITREYFQKSRRICQGRIRRTGMNGYPSPPMRKTLWSFSHGAHMLWIVFGHPPSLRCAPRNDPSPPYNYDDYLSELKRLIQTAPQGAKDKLLANKVRSKDYYDKGTDVMKTEMGDKVLIFDETVRQGRSRKLSSQRIVPLEVIEFNKENITTRKGLKLIKLYVNRLKSFY